MPNGVPALESAQYIVSRSIGKESWQEAAAFSSHRASRHEPAGPEFIEWVEGLTADYHFNLAIPYQDRGFLA
jgi:hypothetical protein